MATDNASAFNCREITGGGRSPTTPGAWRSTSTRWRTPMSRATSCFPHGRGVPGPQRRRPGMIVEGDVVVTAFAAIGFEWGGDWNRLRTTSTSKPRTEAGPGPGDDASRATSTNPVATRSACANGAPRSSRCRRISCGTDSPSMSTAISARRRRRRSVSSRPTTGSPLTGWSDRARGQELSGSGVTPWEVLPGGGDRCSTTTPGSDAWTGEVATLVDETTGRLDVAPFNDFLSSNGAALAAPCDAARVLLHLDRPLDDGAHAIVIAEPGGVVTVTLDHLADDSDRGAALRARLRGGGRRRRPSDVGVVDAAMPARPRGTTTSRPSSACDRAVAGSAHNASGRTIVRSLHLVGCLTVVTSRHADRPDAVPHRVGDLRLGSEQPFKVVSDFEPAGDQPQGGRGAERRVSSTASASRRCSASPGRASRPPSPGRSSRCSGRR